MSILHVYTSARAAPAVPIYPTADQTKLEQNYGKLPLSFEANQGQSHAQVKFLLTHGPGYALFLTPTEAVPSLNKTHALSKSRRGNSDKHRDRMRTVGRVPSLSIRPISVGPTSTRAAASP
ncbi:MAG: hypothetical protein ACREYE_12810 [Gammaproteobacteria bacterium]